MAFALPCHVIPARHGHERLRCLYSFVDVTQIIYSTCVIPLQILHTPFLLSCHPNVGPCVIAEQNLVFYAWQPAPFLCRRSSKLAGSKRSYLDCTNTCAHREVLATHFVEEAFRYRASLYMSRTCIRNHVPLTILSYCDYCGRTTVCAKCYERKVIIAIMLHEAVHNMLVVVR